MARRKELASTQEVRDWGQKNNWDVSDRGRLHSGLIRAFNKAHSDRVYTPDVRSTATNRVQPDAPQETPRKRAAAATQNVTAETAPVKSGMVEGLPEIMEMLQAASKNGKGQKVLLAAYTLTDLDG